MKDAKSTLREKAQQDHRKGTKMIQISVSSRCTMHVRVAPASEMIQIDQIAERMQLAHAGAREAVGLGAASVR